jgi:hypothetical protein
VFICSRFVLVGDYRCSRGCHCLKRHLVNVPGHTCLCSSQNRCAKFFLFTYEPGLTPWSSIFRIKPSSGFTRCAHSVQLPSYSLRCCVGYPASVNAASMTAAVTPVPQLLMMGLEASTPFDLKTAWSSDAGRRVLSFGSRRSVIGMDMEYGIWPDDRPV